MTHDLEKRRCDNPSPPSASKIPSRRKEKAALVIEKWSYFKMRE